MSVHGSRRRGILPRLLRAALLLDAAKKRQDAASTIPGRERARTRSEGVQDCTPTPCGTIDDFSLLGDNLVRYSPTDCVRKEKDHVH